MLIRLKKGIGRFIFPLYWNGKISNIKEFGKWPFVYSHDVLMKIRNMTINYNGRESNGSIFMLPNGKQVFISDRDLLDLFEQVK